MVKNYQMFKVINYKVSGYYWSVEMRYIPEYNLGLVPGCLGPPSSQDDASSDCGWETASKYRG